jgi:hypothetical protein
VQQGQRIHLLLLQQSVLKGVEDLLRQRDQVTFPLMSGRVEVKADSLPSPLQLHGREGGKRHLRQRRRVPLPPANPASVANCRDVSYTMEW